MRFLLDTNILIPLEDSNIPLQPGLANFVRLAQENGHPLVFHPASEEDINRDRDAERRVRTQVRLAQYSRLDGVSNCPLNTPETRPNDACDNAILYAIECDAAHYLITDHRCCCRPPPWPGDTPTRALCIPGARFFHSRAWS